MKKSYLIQRLLRTIPDVDETDDFKSLANEVAYGIEEITGTESKAKIHCLLTEIFRFDHMGSYEFENGKIIEIIKKITHSKEEYFGYEIMTSSYYEGCKFQAYYQGFEPIYIICKPDDLEEIRKRITVYARDAWPHIKEYRTREAVMLNIAMASGGKLRGLREIVGWLELDNGYFFFIDEDMFEKTLTLFGIKKMDDIKSCSGENNDNDQEVPDK